MPNSASESLVQYAPGLETLDVAPKQLLREGRIFGEGVGRCSRYRVFLCSLGCPCSVDQSDLKLWPLLLEFLELKAHWLIK